MRIFNTKQTRTITAAGTINEEPIYLGHIAQFAAQIHAVKTGGTLAGSVKLQASCAPVSSQVGERVLKPDPNAVWTDIPGASHTLTNVADQNALINVSDCGYNWVRAVITLSDGEAIVAVTFNGKGV